MHNIDFRGDAWEDYLYLQKTDKKIIKRINDLIKDISCSPFEGLGHPEALKGNLSGFYSRHINEKDRLVYRIMDDRIEILSCRGHYEKL